MQPAGRISSRRFSLTLVAVAGLSAPAAWAHIDLLEPEARAHGTAARNDPDIDVNSSLKTGPCGQVRSGRTDRVATYAPGQQITVRVREENAHVSYLRVSIDLDGESFPIRTVVPAAPETQEQAQAAEDALGGDGLLAVVRENNDVLGFVHEIPVTLPQTSCNNCTLQVIQFMYDDRAAPYYYQCADLVITDAATGSADAGAAPGNVAPGPAPGAAGASGSGTPAVNGASAAPSSAAGGLGVVPAPPGHARGGAADAVATGAGAMATGAGAPEGAGTVGGGSTPAAAPAAGAEALASASADDKGGCSISGPVRGSAGASCCALFALALALLRRRR